MTDKLVEALIRIDWPHWDKKMSDASRKTVFDAHIPKIKTMLSELDGRHGWQLVPVEPTEVMLQVCAECAPIRSRHLTDAWPQIFKAMLAAAPDPLAEDKP